MKRISMIVTLALVACATFYAANAQPPGGPGERGPGDRGPGGFRPPLHPLQQALDTDGDGEISAKEIEEAVAALKKLDKNSDGKLTVEELRPDFGQRRGPEGRGPEGRGPEGRGPEGRGPEGRGPEGRGPEGRFGFAGPPSPEMFVQRALSFDADGDGKLDRDELTKMAEGFARLRGGPGGPDARGGRPDGEGRPDRPRRPSQE